MGFRSTDKTKSYRGYNDRTFISGGAGGSGFAGGSVPSNVAPGAIQAEYLLVGGGGAGSGGGGIGGGGGGGGEVASGSYTFTVGEYYSVVVGSGGFYPNNPTALYDNIKGFSTKIQTPSLNGNSVLVEAIGGGGGGMTPTQQQGSPPTNAHINGASGGGGSTNYPQSAPNAGGSGVPGKGNPGGAGGGYTGSGNGGGGGGGGALTAGGISVPGPPSGISYGGSGGDGQINRITDTTITYGGGGGGSGTNPTPTPGGLGGGGNGSTPTVSATNGVANTGGGGGGGLFVPSISPGPGIRAGLGGSGVLIIAYPDAHPELSYIQNTLTYTLLPASTRPGYRVYKFTDSSTGGEFRV